MQAIKKQDNTVTFIRILLLSMNTETRDGFIRRLTGDFEPDIQLKEYEFVKAMIRSWAGKSDLSHEDAEIIEDCRKICDVMGWLPIE